MPPPVPGNEQIRPLLNTAQLEQEGRQQGNCVKSYSPFVMAERLYIYKVLQPERATLSIRQDCHGTWQISELKTARNKKVTVATRRFVQAWLDRHNASEPYVE